MERAERKRPHPTRYRIDISSLERTFLARWREVGHERVRKAGRFDEKPASSSQLPRLPRPAATSTEPAVSFIEPEASSMTPDDFARAKFTMLRSKLQEISAAAAQTEPEFRAAFSKHIPSFLVPDARVTYEDTSANPRALAGHKPDGVTLPCGRVLSAVYIQNVFVLKGKDTVDENHLGKSWEYARFVLQHQPWRCFCKCLVITTKEICILEARMEERRSVENVSTGAKVTLSKKVLLSSDEAVFVLDGFLHQDIVDPQIPSSFQHPLLETEVRLEALALNDIQLITSTANGTTYVIGEKHNGNVQVLKMVNDRRMFEIELSALRVLLKDDTLSGVVKALGYDSASRSLLLPFLGTSLEHSRNADTWHVSGFVGLASALKHLHQKARILHRDIRPANIVTLNGQEFYLVDFGLAMVLQTDFYHGNYVGTPMYSAQSQLMAASAESYSLFSAHMCNFSPSTDLESLVKTVMCCMLSTQAMSQMTVLNCAFAADPSLRRSSLRGLHKRWKEIAQCLPIVGTLFQHALNMDYDSLAEALGQALKLYLGKADDLLSG